MIVCAILWIGFIIYSGLDDINDSINNLKK
jgi:hypothetical protein